MLIQPGDIQAYGWGITLFLAACYVLPKAASMIVKLYQDHKDWQRKTQQDKEKWERENDASQDSWQREMIKNMVDGIVVNNAAVIAILNKQSELLAEIKNLIVEGRARRRTDFSKQAEVGHAKNP